MPNIDFDQKPRGAADRGNKVSLAKDGEARF
jgi:hypothetical protein